MADAGVSECVPVVGVFVSAFVQKVDVVVQVFAGVNWPTVDCQVCKKRVGSSCVNPSKRTAPKRARESVLSRQIPNEMARLTQI